VKCSHFFRSKDAPACEVCVRGSLLVSLIRKDNNFTGEDLDNMSCGYFDSWSVEDKRLLELFSPEQLSLIEYAFENFSADRYINEKDLDKVEDFFVLYEHNNTERLIAILKNIIKNKGTFKP